jgi:hypothetical protein
MGQAALSGRRSLVAAAAQFEFDPGQDHLDPDPVVAALGKDDVAIPLGGLDESMNAASMPRNS